MVDVLFLGELSFLKTSVLSRSMVTLISSSPHYQLDESIYVYILEHIDGESRITRLVHLEQGFGTVRSLRNEVVESKTLEDVGVSTASRKRSSAAR